MEEIEEALNGGTPNLKNQSTPRERVRGWLPQHRLRLYHIPRGQYPHEREATYLQPHVLSAVASDGKKTFVIRNFFLL